MLPTTLNGLKAKETAPSTWSKDETAVLIKAAKIYPSGTLLWLLRWEPVWFEV
jgi:hypothetical protein